MGRTPNLVLKSEWRVEFGNGGSSLPKSNPDNKPANYLWGMYMWGWRLRIKGRDSSNTGRQIHRA